MSWEWDRTVAPVIQPISIADAKAQARIVSDDELGLLNSYINAATDAAEQYLGRGLLTQTWKFTLSQFADVMWLPMAAPLASVTSVKYYDENGALQTLSTSIYTVDTTCRPGKIVRAPNQVWPTVQSDRLSSTVEITYVVGWTAAALVPERIKQGIRLYLSAAFADREGKELESMRPAIEACWTDRVFWKEPQCYAVEY